MTLFEIFYCAVLILIFWVALSSFWHERRAKIVPAPVLPWVRKRALQLALARTDPSNPYRIADLGSGWGGLMQALARHYPDAQVTGYEISPWPYRISKWRLKFLGKRVQVVRDDFFEKDLSQYDVIFCYLSPFHMKALIPQFQTLKPGSIIVSCSFEIPEWKPQETSIVKGLVEIPVYVYEVKNEL